LNATEPKARNQ